MEIGLFMELIFNYKFVPFFGFSTFRFLISKYLMDKISTAL